MFAGGCFWGTQGVFERVKGVLDTAAGYAGGSAATATYDQVTTETTGHAESVEVTYDPAKITYGQLLRVFFSVAHDPTQLNRQGPDQGTSYRSAIFYANDDQKRIAQAYVGQLDAASVVGKKIVTESDSAKGFYRAEEVPPRTTRCTTPAIPTSWFATGPRSRRCARSFPKLFQDYKGKK